MALADDVSAVYWNPAGLTQLGCQQAGFMHAAEMSPTQGPAMTTDMLAWSSGATEFGAFGCAAFLAGLSSVYQERTVMASYGAEIGRFTRAGASLKYLGTSSEGQGNLLPDPALAAASTVGVDFGVLQDITLDLRLGLLARNLFARSGIVERQAMRRTYRVGAAWRLCDLVLPDDRVWLTLDLFTRDDVGDLGGTSLGTGVGAEWRVNPMGAIRLGLDRGQWTAGLGLRLMGASVDYAVGAKLDGAGFGQRVSLIYRFGGPPPAGSPPRSARRPPPVVRATYAAVTTPQRTGEERLFPLETDDADEMAPASGDRTGNRARSASRKGRTADPGDRSKDCRQDGGTTCLASACPVTPCRTGTDLVRISSRMSRRRALAIHGRVFWACSAFCLSMRLPERMGLHRPQPGHRLCTKRRARPGQPTAPELPSSPARLFG